MARETFEDWIPTEIGPNAIQAAVMSSAVERVARPEPMASDTKQVPRAGGFTVANVAKGAAYVESTATNDYVEMIARKIGGLDRIAEEDLNDTVTAERTLNIKRVEATRALAKFFDNATLGVTAASNGTTIPYTSVYRALSQNNAATGYTGNANIIPTTGAALYEDFNEAFGLIEDSDWFDPTGTVVIASPAWKKHLRSVVNEQGDPMWRQGLSGGDPDTLFDYPMVWSQGARTHATASQSPTGNPLMVIVTRSLLIKGMAGLTAGQAPTNPGFELQRAAVGVGFTTDETLLKAVLRRGFTIGHEKAFAIIEKTPAS